MDLTMLSGSHYGLNGGVTIEEITDDFDNLTTKEHYIKIFGKDNTPTDEDMIEETVSDANIMSTKKIDKFTKKKHDARIRKRDNTVIGEIDTFETHKTLEITKNPPLRKLKEKCSLERYSEVDVEQTTQKDSDKDSLMIPKIRHTNENIINDHEVTHNTNQLNTIQKNKPKLIGEKNINIDEVTHGNSEEHVVHISKTTSTHGQNTETTQYNNNSLTIQKIDAQLNQETQGNTDFLTIQNLNTTLTGEQNTQENTDSLTIQKINAKLTAEIINMQRIMSHMDMQDSLNRLKQLNTIELYNEMMKCVERNLAKVVQKKCSCDTSNWEQFNTDLFQTGSCATDIQDNLIETEDLEEVFENTEDLNHTSYVQSHRNQTNFQNKDRNYFKESYHYGNSIEIFEQFENEYEEDEENVGENVNTEEIENPCELLTLVTQHINNEELNRHYEQLEDDYKNLVAQIKEGRKEVKFHTNTISNLREEISEKEGQLVELEEKVAVLNKECGQLRGTLETLKEEHHYQNIIIEGMKKENNELMGTLETYTEQAGNTKKAIDGLFKELKRSNSALDKVNLHSSVLEERLGQMRTKNSELEDENMSMREQIYQLERKIENLTNKFEENEEKYKELVAATQKKLLGQEKLQKQLKLIITKKNFLINAFRSEVAKNAKDGILLSKIQRSEAKINKIMKEKIESLANVSNEILI